MIETIHPSSALRGAVRLPGDKSISHRYGMLASISEGTSVLSNYSSGADCHSTLGCMEAMGARIEKNGTEITVHGVGLEGLQAPAGMLDAGNSGSTIRMLSGILSAQPFVSTIGGDESLSKRPMARIMNPLAEMGAAIEAKDGGAEIVLILERDQSLGGILQQCIHDGFGLHRFGQPRDASEGTNRIGEIFTHFTEALVRFA